MIGHAQPDCASFRVLQALRYLASCRQDERIWTRGHGLDQPISPVIHPGVNADLGKVATDQGEVVFFVRSPDAVNPVNGARIPDVAAKRVTGVCRVRDQAAAVDGLDD